MADLLKEMVTRMDIAMKDKPAVQRALMIANAIRKFGTDVIIEAKPDGTFHIRLKS